METTTLKSGRDRVDARRLAAVTENIRDGDMLIYTGDFNCWSPLLDSNFQLVPMPRRKRGRGDAAERWPRLWRGADVPW